MASDNQTEFKGWARVEVMGHQTHIGFVETQAFGGVVLFRIDQPAIPAEEVTLETSEWVDDGSRVPAGSVVRRSEIPAASVLVGAGSIYRIIPCNETAALQAIRTSAHRPLLLVKLGELRQVSASPESDEIEDYDEVELGSRPQY
jgi:hypothetical protein